MRCMLVTVATLAAAGGVTCQDMFGSSSSSWQQGGPGWQSSSSSSSSSSSGGGGSTSTINQSEPGGRVEMRCGGVGNMVWYRQEAGGRLELARNGRLSSSAPNRYRLDTIGGSDVFTISPAETSDSGVFICESTDASGQRSRSTYTVTIGGGGGNGASARTAGAAAGFMGAMMLLM